MITHILLAMTPICPTCRHIMHVQEPEGDMAGVRCENVDCIEFQVGYRMQLLTHPVYLTLDIPKAFG